MLSVDAARPLSWEWERDGLREETGEGIGGALCHDINIVAQGPSNSLSLLGFITTVSLTANTHCMTDGLTLACLVP